MKKALTFLFAAIMYLTLVACSNNKNNYVGTWTAKGVSPSTNATCSRTLHLYEDGTFVPINENSIDGCTVKASGNWEIKKNRVVLECTFLEVGEHICFNTDGSLKTDTERHIPYDILDSAKLQNGNIVLEKQP